MTCACPLAFAAAASANRAADKDKPLASRLVSGLYSPFLQALSRTFGTEFCEVHARSTNVTKRLVASVYHKVCLLASLTCSQTAH